jgi:hypothetical protein
VRDPRPQNNHRIPGPREPQKQNQGNPMKDISKSFEIISETVIEFVEGLECSKDIDSQLEAKAIKAALVDTGSSGYRGSNRGLQKNHPAD